MSDAPAVLAVDDGGCSRLSFNQDGSCLLAVMDRSFCVVQTLPLAALSVDALPSTSTPGLCDACLCGCCHDMAPFAIPGFFFFFCFFFWFCASLPGCSPNTGRLLLALHTPTTWLQSHQNANK